MCVKRGDRDSEEAQRQHDDYDPRDPGEENPTTARREGRKVRMRSQIPSQTPLFRSPLHGASRPNFILLFGTTAYPPPEVGRTRGCVAPVLVVDSRAVSLQSAYPPQA